MLLYDLNNPVDWSGIGRNIFADTNVLCPVFYDNSALVANALTKTSLKYQNAISGILTSGVHLHIPSLVLLEMSHVFVKWDMAIYRHLNPGVLTSGNLKEYRRLQGEMLSRKRRYSLIFSQINGIAELEIDDIEVSRDDVADYLNAMDSHAMDANDYLIALHAKRENGVLMTDDLDFANTAAPVDLMTQNSRLITKAQSLGYRLANPL